MLRTAVGRAVFGVVVAGAFFALVGLVKILQDGIDKGCRTIGRT